MPFGRRVAAAPTSCWKTSHCDSKWRRPPRPPFEDVDRAFWVALRQSWPGWTSRLVIVKADTVAWWHRERFRRFWAKISQRRHPGRPRLDAEIRQLIRTMAQDGWGAPRIHAELTKLGFVLSEITVSRYMPRRPVEPDQVKRWVAFLRNHKDDIAAMDLFTVPTVEYVTCSLLGREGLGPVRIDIDEGQVSTFPYGSEMKVAYLLTAALLSRHRLLQSCKHLLVHDLQRRSY